jgi:Xaa-Pro aminopeptidase
MVVEQMRLIKEPAEVDCIREAIRCAAQALKMLRDIIEPGMSENEVAAEMEYLVRRAGADYPPFPAIIAVGENASLCHYRPRDKKLAHKCVVLVDWGAQVKGYCSDITRMIYLNGLDSYFERLHEIVLQAQQSALERIRPGVTLGQIDCAARNAIKRKGYGDYFGHGLGHGVGLQVHEAPPLHPRSKVVVQPGMVFTVEPGIYIPGRGGVRIEDMVLVTENGCEVLTEDIPKFVADCVLEI